MLNFSDLLPEIKKRPTLYLSRYSIFDFQSFYYGYDLARNQLGLPRSEKDQQFEEFLLWLRERYKIETTQSWASLILFHSVDERDALQRLFDLWEEFKNSNESYVKSVIMNKA
ncbi:MAG: hypothetical protein F6K48_06270 [Okeania sp. SIO3H1]|uniref:hypothetical protein n=1 Tax=Okeania sp. SIO1I7 TaxID=2607772 RepID=UPI0013CB52E7|nr:hypothetical protein [Okeania sp. SIO1I7]NEN88552.1 hypothetical protein [Okeania sp. SIO3H1]NET28180.1 hypothetical protein [Okeania sp. SIO1I7]